MSVDWAAIGSIASALAVAFSAVALFQTQKSLRSNALAMELSVLESIQKDIRELDRDYIAHFQDMTPAQKTAWSASFFNTVEYLCFVINRNGPNASLLKGFFLPEALSSWRTMHDEHVATGILKNSPKSFDEFKRLTQTRPSGPPRVSERRG